MHNITRSALVSHDAEDMYLLAADVAAYPEFLPWCEDAGVLEQSEHAQLARVRIAYSGVRKSFTTRNQLFPFERIEMGLVEGPFTALRGAWNFKFLRAGACRVSLDLQFEVAGAMRHVLAPVFKSIAGSLVDSFVARANEVCAGGFAGADKTAAINVEVVYALQERQIVEQVRVTPPATIARAIKASNIPAQFPRLDLQQTAVGVFGARRPPDWTLCAGDRVEIYRPLTRAPVDARRRRARL